MINTEEYVKVVGFSMVPTLYNGDILIIKKQCVYKQGDILVYTYGNHIVVHRFLNFKGNRYLCKGDNSFRLEEILYNQILGKVIIVKRKNEIFRPPQISYEFLRLSLKVNEEFTKNQHNIKLTTQSETYQKFIAFCGAQRQLVRWPAAAKRR